MRLYLVAKSLDVVRTEKVLQSVQSFYPRHNYVAALHGIGFRTYQHAITAIACHTPTTC
jgi:hypothetical protein